MRYRVVFLTLAGFLTALLVGEALLRAVDNFTPASAIWPTSEMELKAQQIRSLRHDIDLVVVGSSASEAGIDVDRVVATAGLIGGYNAAVPFATPETNEFWLEEVILDEVNPRVVVIGLVPWAVHDDSSRLIEAMRAAEVADLDLTRSPSELWNNTGVLADWDTRRVRERLIGSGLWRPNGQFAGYETSSFTNSAPGLTPSAPADPARHREAIERMIRLSRASGASVVLLLEPTCCLGLEVESLVAEFGEWIGQESERWGVEVLQYPRENLDRSWFADSRHLNGIGTQHFSDWLGHRLLAAISRDIAMGLRS